MKTTITISRQLASGGSYVGQVVASRMGLKYVDREVLQAAAEEFGCDCETIEARAERVRSFWERILSGLAIGGPDSTYNPPPLANFSDRELFNKQTEILRKIAGKHDCVVIGWAGVHVLPRHEGKFSVFCHAPLSFRLRRMRQIYGVTDGAEARQMLLDSDEMRNKYYETMTGHDWDCADDYNLSIDTSLLPLDQVATLLIDIYQKVAQHRS